jgi:hypothetical protein
MRYIGQREDAVLSILILVKMVNRMIFGNDAKRLRTLRVPKLYAWNLTYSVDICKLVCYYHFRIEATIEES